MYVWDGTDSVRLTLQMTPSPPLRTSRYGAGSQQLSFDTTTVQQSPMSPPIADSRAHSVPTPMHSPPPYSPNGGRPQQLQQQHHHSPVRISQAFTITRG